MSNGVIHVMTPWSSSKNIGRHNCSAFALRLALTLLLHVFLVFTKVSADDGIQTVLHITSPTMPNVKLQLDVEIMDSFGTPIPWGDLHVHHGRKMHIYVLHEV